MLQIPDSTHRAAELEGIPYDTFSELVDDILEHSNETVMLPSNLVLMYQAAMCVTLTSHFLVEDVIPAAQPLS